MVGAAAWNINSDEPSLIDYDMTFKKPAQDALFPPDAFRSSDHDPVLIGLDLTPPDTTAPELTATPSPEARVPAEQQVAHGDDRPRGDRRLGGEVTVELVEATADGNRGDIRVISDTEVQVLAKAGATYTLVYEATDPSGNTTTETVRIRVGR